MLINYFYTRFLSVLTLNSQPPTPTCAFTNLASYSSFFFNLLRKTNTRQVYITNPVFVTL